MTNSGHSANIVDVTKRVTRVMDGVRRANIHGVGERRLKRMLDDEDGHDE